ncbi:MAG: ThuA domain-containing protein [Faecalibacterium sp.]
MKKIIMLGDYENYPYHPFGGVDQVLKQALGGAYQITCTGDYDIMCDLSGYELFVCYTDSWRPGDVITPAQAAGVVTYVANGGKLLVLHCGISLQLASELIPLMGAKFTTHPEMTEIAVHMLDETDPITKGVSPFTTVEEPYQFAFDAFSNITMLSEYQLDGKTYPHSWKKPYCKGEVVYLMGGHTADIMAEEGNITLFKNAVDYLLG